MDISVQTGQTKKQAGAILVSHALTSLQGEHVALLLQIEADPQDAKTLEKESRAIMEHALLETEGEAAGRLDSCLKELNGLFKGLLLTGTIRDVHAITAIIDTQGLLHISPAGRAEAYVIRAGVASQITEYSRGKPAPAFIHITSGELEPRDIVVFSTQRLLRTVTPAQLSQIAVRGDQLVDELVLALEAEKEQSALAVFHIAGSPVRAALKEKPVPAKSKMPKGKLPPLPSLQLSTVTDAAGKVMKSVASQRWIGKASEGVGSVLKDLKHPERKKRAHLLLVAGTLGIFLIAWAGVNLLTSSQRSHSRAELEALVTQINTDLQTAENRHLTGEMDSANAILQRAEDRARLVMENESGLFRTEALTLLDQIRAKREQINNITRLAPRVQVNLTSKKPEIEAQGLVGLADGEFLAFDRQDVYRVVLNTVDEPQRITDEALIVQGANFPRFQTQVFQTQDNTMIELTSGEAVTMKTDDPAGWITGKDMETYLRYIYILSPENNQIYKYERLNNRYAAPAQYNVNGDLKDALDMTLDGNVFVLKKGGEIVKLFRGEAQPFAIRYLPDGALNDTTKIYKVPEGNLYFLDPVHARIVVATGGGATGESSYVKQFILEGEQLGELIDLYVDPDEARMYVMDDKRIYAIDLVK